MPEMGQTTIRFQRAWLCLLKYGHYANGDIVGSQFEISRCFDE